MDVDFAVAKALFWKGLNLGCNMAQPTNIVAFGRWNTAFAGDNMALTPNNLALSHFNWR